MAEEFLMPEIGRKLSDRKISRWLKDEGDAFSIEDWLVEVDTDIATIALPAKRDGKVLKILRWPGELVAVGEPIAIIGDFEEDLPESLTRPPIIDWRS